MLILTTWPTCTKWTGWTCRSARSSICGRHVNRAGRSSSTNSVSEICNAFNLHYHNNPASSATFQHFSYSIIAALLDKYGEQQHQPRQAPTFTHLPKSMVRRSYRAIATAACIPLFVSGSTRRCDVSAVSARFLCAPIPTLQNFILFTTCKSYNVFMQSFNLEDL